MTLSIHGVTITYGSAGSPAVDDVTLEVATGEVIALLGPSGCGKSSLLRAVAGLEPLIAGRIEWDGRDLAGTPVHRRGFGLMFQDGQLFPHRDVAGNVAFGLQMAGRRDYSRVSELLELVGLAGYERRPISTLSGGEQQRVALARALAPQPRLLLLDEPLSALDRGLREHLAVEIAEILRTTGTTAVYVTHDHDEAFTVADQVALMRAGRLVQTGTPADLWAAPVDAQAATFLGYRVVTDDGGTCLALGPRAVRVAHPGEAPDATGVVTGLTFARGERLALVDVERWGGQVRARTGAIETEPGSAVGLILEADGTIVLEPGSAD
ncbi:ABC transporter ATP-binding protein [Pseudactinotalea sp.]|uniref:ABC transporter ATP-binding protein n=1 Tax=Pseudactinotalea sp. TaxID=1926260 RepID=UPI003B3AD2E6